MESPQRIPDSPGNPLQQVSPERQNQRQWDLPQSPPAGGGGGGGGKHSRDSSVHEKITQFNSLAFQGKQLERKANDAALKRAMVGREEAESEMRRYRDEARVLRRHIEEGKERERKVGERLESVMENYGRAKETHAHTQALWEKEIRRARKEGFKSQSIVVKMQEELKASRDTLRMVQGGLEQEKSRSMKREQEAFSARYQVVGMQEEITQLQDKIKLVEQERDAFKAIAKNEEVARIAAEGRIPLPHSSADDEFSSPKKSSKPADAITIISSNAGDEELDEIKMKLEWENQRANRAYDRIEFLEMERQLHVCAAKIAGLEKLSQLPLISKHTPAKKNLKPRTSTVFIPAEGIFRTVSPSEEAPNFQSSERKSLNATINFEQPAAPDASHEQKETTSRAPSCEPDDTSLLSIFDGESNTNNTKLQNQTHIPEPLKSPIALNHEHLRESTRRHTNEDMISSHKTSTSTAPTTIHHHEHKSTFHTVSTTTRIPLADPDSKPMKIDTNLPLPSNADNSAVTPTVTREEALAMIRERRGRARSFAQGTLTPRKQMIEGAGSRRDISAPAGRPVSRDGTTTKYLKGRT